MCLPEDVMVWHGSFFITGLVSDLFQTQHIFDFLLLGLFFFLLVEMLVEDLWRWLTYKDADKKRMIVLTFGQADPDLD